MTRKIHQMLILKLAKIVGENHLVKRNMVIMISIIAKDQDQEVKVL